MNFRLKRFLETTLPIIVLHGFVVAIITSVFGLYVGILPIVIYAIVDITMLSPRDMVPKNIQYNGKYFRTLTELIHHIKEEKDE